MIRYFSLLESNTMGSLTTRKTYGLKGYFAMLSKVSGDEWGLEAYASSLPAKDCKECVMTG